MIQIDPLVDKFPLDEVMEAGEVTRRLFEESAQITKVRRFME